MILDQIQQEINKAVRERKEYKDLVNGKVDLLNKLKAQIKECIQKVSASSFENKAIYKQKLNQAMESIDQILKDSAPLINRFNRDTINLGVAGATQAGKSTFLEAVSGVKLPRAGGERSGDSTTAAKSIIINSAEKRTTVYFRTKQEFVALANAYLPEKYRGSVSDLADFENLPLDKIKSDPDISSSERYEVTLLKDAQASFHCFRNLLVGGQKDIDIADLADYVTFYQCKDPKEEHRFWAAVKLVEIRCPFVALGDSDIKLTLVDLPGMGQCPRVNAQMVDELENEVDTVMLLFKTTAVKPDDDANTFDAIKNAQKYVKDKTKFLSFLINVVENDENRCGNVNSIKIRIDDVFKHNNDEDYKTYETSIINADGTFNSAKVHQDVVGVLSKLVGDIKSLDADTYNGWIGTLDITDLKNQVNEIANQIKNDLPYSEDDDDLLDGKKTDLKAAFADYNDLEDNYIVKNTIKEISREINSKINEISTNIENLPLGKEVDKWKVYFAEQRKQYKGVAILTPELIRLWTYIRSEYRAIEKVADKFLVKLKNDIIDKFNEIVKVPFITKRGDEGITELIDKIEGTEAEMPMIISAFKSLMDDKISFNQLVYQYIVSAELAKSISNDSKKGGLISDDSFKVPEGTSDDDERDHYGNKLTHVVLDVNKEMAEIISDKTPFAVAAYLYAKAEYFNDCLNRSTFDEKEKDLCFKHFCKTFRLELWPDQFGKSSETVLVREITKSLTEISKLINELNKL